MVHTFVFTIQEKSQCRDCIGSSIYSQNKINKSVQNVMVLLYVNIKKSNCKGCNPNLRLIRLHTNQIKRDLTSVKI
jgi:hypothetical protein